MGYKHRYGRGGEEREEVDEIWLVAGVDLNVVNSAPPLSSYLT